MSPVAVETGNGVANEKAERLEGASRIGRRRLRAAERANLRDRALDARAHAQSYSPRFSLRGAKMVHIFSTLTPFASSSEKSLIRKSSHALIVAHPSRSTQLRRQVRAGRTRRARRRHHDDMRGLGRIQRGLCRCRRSPRRRSRHERAGNAVNAAMTCGQRLEKSLPFLVSSRTPPSARLAMMRIWSCLTS